MIKSVNETLKVLLIFADSSVKTQKAVPEELQELLQSASDKKQEKLEFFTTTARELSYFVSNDFSAIYDHANKMDLKDYNLVYFRKAGTVMQQMLACASYLEAHNIPYFDKEIGLTTSRNKLSQMFLMQAHGISVPTTLFTRKRSRLVRLLKTTYKDNFTWPVIAKATGGTRGDANFLVKTPEELETIVKEQKRHFLIQSFIPNDGDFRALVVYNQLRGLIKRVGEEGSHLNNTSKAGSAAWLPLSTFDATLETLSISAAQLFHRDIAGVDVLIDKHTNQPYILEVNRAPQIERASYPEEKADVIVDGIVEAINDREIPPKSAKAHIIGRREKVSVVELPALGELIAKVDTGAYSNTLHVESVQEIVGENGKRKLRFLPTANEDDAYETDRYFVKKVVSSNGSSEERYVVELQFKMGDDTYVGQVTLTHRGSMRTPVLIGRRFLRHNKFIVDTSKKFVL